jgi:hypothetical protein
MQQRHSRETNSCTSFQEIPYHNVKPKVRYCVHKSPSFLSTLSQMNPTHALSRYEYSEHSLLFRHWNLGFVCFGATCRITDNILMILNERGLIISKRNGNFLQWRDTWQHKQQVKTARTIIPPHRPREANSRFNSPPVSACISCFSTTSCTPSSY